MIYRENNYKYYKLFFSTEMYILLIKNNLETEEEIKIKYDKIIAYNTI